MYGSEELEPGYGWDYVAIGNYLAEKPTADGVELGKVVVDSFYESCAAAQSETEATLSCIDLRKIDELVYAFNEVAQNMYESSGDIEIFSLMLKGIVAAENFGGNNRSEGYTNMVDLGCLLENISDYVEGTDAALAALDNCVVYMKNGSSKLESNGLSTYYPLELQGPGEYSIFKNICVSPYYMSFVDKIAYGSNTNGMFDDYDDENWFGDGSAYWSDDYDVSDDYWDYLEGVSDDDYNFDGENCAVSLSQEAQLDDEGTFGCVISQGTLDYASAVYCCVFLDAGDGDTLIDLGVDDNVYVDWDTGEVYDNFDGYWFALPDGQPLATYIVEQEDAYNIYTSPVLLNGEETNLRIRMDYNDSEDYTIKIIGAWDGIDETTGMSAKEIKKLRKGDIM
jgi:hypothetical protein